MTPCGGDPNFSASERASTRARRWGGLRKGIGMACGVANREMGMSVTRPDSMDRSRHSGNTPARTHHRPDQSVAEREFGAKCLRRSTGTTSYGGSDRPSECAGLLAKRGLHRWGSGDRRRSDDAAFAWTGISERWSANARVSAPVFLTARTVFGARVLHGRRALSPESRAIFAEGAERHASA